MNLRVLTSTASDMVDLEQRDEGCCLPQEEFQQR